MQERTKVTIGIPHQTEVVNTRFVNSLVKLVRFEALAGREFEIVETERQLPDIARIEVVAEAMRNESTHVLFIDDDMIFDEDFLYRLLRHNTDMVGALAWQRRAPFFPSMYRYNPKPSGIGDYDPIISTSQLLDKDYKWGDLFEVDGIGLAFTLIKIEVFKKLTHPLFRFERKGGEDLSFCKRVKKAGFKIHCDTSTVAGHLVTDELRFKNYEEYRNYGKLQQIKES